MAISLSTLHNFASHLHSTAELCVLVRIDYMVNFAEFIHYVKIGSKFCPRALLATEHIIKKIYLDGREGVYKEYLETKNEKAYE